MMGPGYWLNPNNDQLVRVGTTHDAWILNQQNAKSIGLPDFVYDIIKQFKPTEIDNIRRAAMKGGLIRIRDHGNSTSVQFDTERHRVKTYLWSILVALKGQLKLHPDTMITITNLSLNDEVTLTLADLQSRLENEQSVLHEETDEGIYDVPKHHPSGEKVRMLFKKYLEQQAK